MVIRVAKRHITSGCNEHLLLLISLILLPLVGLSGLTQKHLHINLDIGYFVYHAQDQFNFRHKVSISRIEP